MRGRERNRMESERKTVTRSLKRKKEAGRYYAEGQVRTTAQRLLTRFLKNTAPATEENAKSTIGKICTIHTLAYSGVHFVHLYEVKHKHWEARLSFSVEQKLLSCRQGTGQLRCISIVHRDRTSNLVFALQHPRYRTRASRLPRR